MKKGNYSTKYNPERLRNLLLQGKDAQEIMDEFHISPYTLNEHIFMLEKEDNRPYSISGLYETQRTNARKSKYGRFCLSADLLSETGLKQGDTCEIVVRDGQIILQKNAEKTV